MTASNHMLAGAALALSVQRPLLVMALAFLSHFVLDAMPHFGIHADEHDHERRHKHPLFWYILAIDFMLSIALLLYLPFAVDGAIPAWLVLAGMLCAWIPDVIWSYRMRHEIRFKKLVPHSWFSKLHTNIQWFEKPPGMVIELLWFAGIVMLIAHLAL